MYGGVDVYVQLGDDSVHAVPGAEYGDFDDAGGDFRGDLWAMIAEAFPGATIKEIRLVPNKPFNIKDVWGRNEE